MWAVESLRRRDTIQYLYHATLPGTDEELFGGHSIAVQIDVNNAISEVYLFG